MEQIKSSVKVVGLNGQISLGKEFAGRQVLIEEEEPGVWKVRTALVIPENELWMHESRVKEQLYRAMNYSISDEPRETTDIHALLKDLEHGKQQSESGSKQSRISRKLVKA